ncbi:unnamed protein product, partial [Dicrocoelium dendriticum]
MKLPSLNNSVRRTPIRAPVSARSAAPSSTQPCRVSGRPSTTEPMRSRVSSLTSKSTALKSAPVTPRSDFSSRLRLGVKATTTVGRSTGASSTSSPATSKPEGRVSGSQTPCSTNVTVPNRFGIPTASAPKRVPVTRSLAGHKSPELPTNPSSARCHSSAALTPRTAAPAKRTPAKTTASTMKITPPRNQIPAVINSSASPSAAAPVLSRSTTQRSSIPNR